MRSPLSTGERVTAKFFPPVTAGDKHAEAASRSALGAAIVSSGRSSIRPVGGDGGRRPVVGHYQKVPLHPEQIALIKELQALFLQRLEERREEGDEAPEAQLHWEGSVEPELSDVSDEKRKQRMRPTWRDLWRLTPKTRVESRWSDRGRAGAATQEQADWL